MKLVSEELTRRLRSRQLRGSEHQLTPAECITAIQCHGLPVIGNGLRCAPHYLVLDTATSVTARCWLDLDGPGVVGDGALSFGNGAVSVTYVTSGVDPLFDHDNVALGKGTDQGGVIHAGRLCPTTSVC
jgi:hypothetical protein